MKALAFGEKNENFTVIGYACCWLSWVCTELGLLDDAIGYAERAQRILKADRRDDFIYVSSMSGMGYAFWHRGDKPKTLEVGNVLLDFGRKQGDYRAKGMGNSCIGWIHLIGGDLEKATLILKKPSRSRWIPGFHCFPSWHWLMV